MSGVDGFMEFLETTAELLVSPRTTTTSPKIVMLGRWDAVDDAEVMLELVGDGQIHVSSLDIDYFDEPAAREVVHAYAQQSAINQASEWLRPEPAERALALFFSAIEAALELDSGEVWDSDHGRAFVGYAPVLEALGTILADETNHQRLASRLEHLETATGRAWDVMEDVIQAILDREQEKLADQLHQRGVRGATGAYDVAEQLRLLAEVSHGRTPTPKPPGSLSGADAATYRELVQQWLPTHAFLREGQLANPVFAAIVLAHGVIHDLPTEWGDGPLASESRNPFLWRSVERRLTRDLLIDGRYVGPVLHSLWNDPLELVGDVRVRARPADDAGSVNIEISGGRTPRAVQLTAISPLEFLGVIRSADVQVDGDVVWRGRSESSGQSVLEVRSHLNQDGDSLSIRSQGLVLTCGRLEVRTDVVRFAEGASWVAADEVVLPPHGQVNLKVASDATVGWGGALRNSWPWSDYASTVEPPAPPPARDAFEELLQRCVDEFSKGTSGAAVTVLVLGTDYRPIEDQRLDWLNPRYSTAFPQLIALLVEADLAASDADKSTSGQRKVQVRLKTTWSKLLAAARGGRADLEASVVEFVEDVREQVSALVQD